MKKHLFFLIGILFSLNLIAQDNTPPYKKHPGVPPFNLVHYDGKKITKDQLKKGQPVMIMFFSPKCDHCQKQTKDMLANMNKLKNTQIVMASYEPLADLKAFAIQYKLNHNNIYIGRDETFFLPPFYKIGALPFIATYDKSGNLVNVHEGNVDMAELIKELSR